MPLTGCCPALNSCLKIAIATGGRFHVLDLARELKALGHQVKFYSYVPATRALRFGLPRECHVSLLLFVWPFLIWQRIAPKLGRKLRERLTFSTLNLAVICRLTQCDVFICMSGIYLEAAHFAKRKFGARIWLERGSQHILSQMEILKQLSRAERPSEYVVKREIEGYAFADRIVIPSSHVADSFRQDVAAYRKLMQIPYGVDLEMFPISDRERNPQQLNVLFIGAWSLQKGCDLLEGAIKTVPNTKLTHVGEIVDVAFPKNDLRFIHHSSVPQTELSRWLAKADVFVLASRQDGFGVVLVQALASGLPVICTDRTGGSDLCYTPTIASRITIVPNGDDQALAGAIRSARDRVMSNQQIEPISASDRAMLSWTAYGERYNAELVRDVSRE